jgi:hypothetical protein
MLKPEQPRTLRHEKLPSEFLHWLCATSKMPTSLGVEHISAVKMCAHERRYVQVGSNKAKPRAGRAGQSGAQTGSQRESALHAFAPQRAQRHSYLGMSLGVARAGALSKWAWARPLVALKAGQARS